MPLILDNVSVYVQYFKICNRVVSLITVSTTVAAVPTVAAVAAR